MDTSCAKNLTCLFCRIHCSDEVGQRSTAHSSCARFTSGMARFCMISSPSSSCFLPRFEVLVRFGRLSVVFRNHVVVSSFFSCSGIIFLFPYNGLCMCFVVFHLYAFEMKRFLLVCPKKQQRLDAFEGCDSKYHNPVAWQAT